MEKTVAKKLTKTAFEKVLYTEKELMELRRCAEDPIYMMESFMRVLHPVKGEVPFKLFEYQKRMIQAYLGHRQVISLTGRQLGKTECAVGFLLWYAMFHPTSNILIAANKYDQALEIMKRVKFAYESLPDHIRAGVKYYAMERVEFDNGSTIRAEATTENTGRGKSISVLYLDEFAFVPPNIAKEFWTAIRPTLSTGGKCIITSTPNNNDDQFAQIYRAAENNLDEFGNLRPNGEGVNGFFHINVPWSEHPDRGEEWAKEEEANIGHDRFLREHCCVVQYTIISLSDCNNNIFDMTMGDLFASL
jgi:phage terminase large subunit-like protein